MSKFLLYKISFIASLTLVGVDGYGTVLVDKTTGGVFTKNSVRDSHGRQVDYYLANSKLTDKPLILFVQGSGCLSNFTKIGGEIRGYQNYVLRSVKNSARVLVVEKPGVKLFDVNEKPGTAIGCNKEFLREHTLERWSEANLAAIKEVISDSKTPILVIGHSEGGMVSAFLAKIDSRISHIALLGTAVGNNLFSSIYLGKKSKQGFEGMHYDELVIKWKDIVTDKDSISKFAWGHPYKRMASFVKFRTYDLLGASQAKLFIGHGTKDSSSAIEVFDLLVSELAYRMNNLFYIFL